MYEQVPPFDQLDAHLLGQKGVLEIGGVGNAGSEKDGGGIVGIGGVFWSERTQDGQQHLRVMVNGPNAVIAEKRRENALKNFAVGQHVGDAARNPQIVLENGEFAVGQANEIGAAYA